MPFARLWAAGPFIAWTSARLLHRRRSQTRLHAPARSRMLRTRAGGTSGGRSARARASARNQRLAGTNRTAIDRLAGDRRGRRLRNSRTRRRRSRGHRRPRSREFRGQIGPRGNDWTRGRLPGERTGGSGTTRLRRHRPSFGTARRQRLTLQIHGRASRRRTSGLRTRRERLTRTGEHLSGARRTGLAGNRSRSRRGGPAGRDHSRRRHRRRRLRRRRRWWQWSSHGRARFWLGQRLMRPGRWMDRPAGERRAHRCVVRQRRRGCRLLFRCGGNRRLGRRFRFGFRFRHRGALFRFGPFDRRCGGPFDRLRFFYLGLGF